MSSNISFRDVFFKGAVIFNPVLVQLIGLCPVVAASTTLKSAVMLSLVACLELIAICVIASAFLKKIPRWLRVSLYLIIGLVLICPVLWIIETKTLINLSLGMKIYLPLIAINSVVAVHCEQVAVKNSVRLAFYDAAAVGIGASVIFILTGAIREILGNGTIGGIALNIPITFKGMLLPFGCLILLGFMAAGLKAFISRRYPEYLEESAPLIKNKVVYEEPEVPDTPLEEVKIFEETDFSEEIKPETVSEELPEQPASAETKFSTADEIEEFFKSLGLDIDEKGEDKQ